MTVVVSGECNFVNASATAAAAADAALDAFTMSLRQYLVGIPRYFCSELTGQECKVFAKIYN